MIRVCWSWPILPWKVVRSGWLWFMYPTKGRIASRFSSAWMVLSGFAAPSLAGDRNAIMYPKLDRSGDLAKDHCLIDFIGEFGLVVRHRVDRPKGGM